jgi:multidrug efflux pump subunit AcrA (membrane-fusion protein)
LVAVYPLPTSVRNRLAISNCLITYFLWQRYKINQIIAVLYVQGDPMNSRLNFSLRGLQCLFNGLQILVCGSFAFVASAYAQPPADKPVEVIVQAASIKSLATTIEALGTLRANEAITLTSNDTKKVTRINFEDGQRVQKGQVLVEMTSREESALLEEARFNADEAKNKTNPYKIRP